jgi:Family of unknown function (DUF6584)
MAKANVLDRVAVDLARGHTQPAIQRLSSLVTAHPMDLDLRRRLAAVHRRVGNLIEAGRWSYLQPDADEAEVQAFERAYPTSAAQLHALRWPGPASSAPTSYARRRLAKLVAATGRHPSEAIAPQRRRLRPSPIALAVALTALIGAVFVVVGAVTVVAWIF